MKLKNLMGFIFPKFVVLLIVLGIILNPQNSINAAKTGFLLWSNILIPSLLPFIICADLIISLKIIDILGAIVNPLTNRVFNVSGKSGLVFAISTVSGYPVGSKYTSKLRLEKQISKYEGQRLASFCSTSGPLFVIGSIGTGMLNNPHLGYVILSCHYIAAILVGICFRNYKREFSPKKKSSIKEELKIAISKSSNSEGFFVLFGNAVVAGVNTILAIGGFVIMFSVFFEILSYFKIIDALSSSLALILGSFKITEEIISAFISGLFEMTIGCNNLYQVENISSLVLIPSISFLIGFSGLSILAQCSSFLAKTDIKVGLYILAKFLHGLFAALLSYTYVYFNKSNLVFNLNSDIEIYNIYDLYTENFIPILTFFIIIYLITYLKKLS